MEHSDLVCLKPVAGKGRGVFARKPIKKGQVIEKVPVILVPFSDFVDGDDNPNLARVYYLWNRKNVAISLGYGSIYNHSYRPNARYKQDPMRLTMSYVALRDIDEGEEITVNYNGDPKGRAPMRFEVVEKPEPVERNGTGRHATEGNGAALTGAHRNGTVRNGSLGLNGFPAKEPSGKKPAPQSSST